ncbi:hypothetical protein BU16DRAFT_562448 [Lophium mytilinum]|uniref:Uncharacterized protein n=1 Tax=Lophium mytilinum TaxID=390894 RepID=A0A6A6QRM8_9PEZI|nr:hypothetical protein BU16DRAFT_562448 [Lophium mytilinum]
MNELQPESSTLRPLSGAFTTSRSKPCSPLDPQSDHTVKNGTGKTSWTPHARVIHQLSKKLQSLPAEIRLCIFGHVFDYNTKAPVAVHPIAAPLKVVQKTPEYDHTTTTVGMRDYGFRWLSWDPRKTLHDWCYEAFVGLNVATEASEAFYSCTWFHLNLEDLSNFVSSPGYKSVRNFKPGNYARYLIIDVGQVGWEPDGTVPRHGDIDRNQHMWGGETIEMDPKTWPRLKMLLDLPKLREVGIYIPSTWQKNEILRLAPTVLALKQRGVRVRLTRGSGESPDEGMEDDMAYSSDSNTHGEECLAARTEVIQKIELGKVRLERPPYEGPVYHSTPERIDNMFRKPTKKDFRHAASYYELIMVALVYRVMIWAPEKFAELLARRRERTELGEDDTSDEDEVPSEGDDDLSEEDDDLSEDYGLSE